LTDREPDYVVLGETRTYSFERITRAIRPDLLGRPVHRDETPTPTGPSDGRPRCPATGLGGGADQPREPASIRTSLARPNPLMMRSALNANRRAAYPERRGG